MAEIVTGKKTQDIGENILNTLKEAKSVEKGLVDRAYNKIPPNIKLKFN